MLVLMRHFLDVRAGARSSDHLERIELARLALDGLSVGDAFGERFFVSPQTVDSLIEARAIPASPWRWTDDTAMALSIVEVLGLHGGIDRDALAQAFARRYWAEPARGYGAGAHRILQAIGEGCSWQDAAATVFAGQGSYGNGGAMRAAPIGAYFWDSDEHVVEHALASADPTHAHPEGRAGAVAVAVAAALAVRMSRGSLKLSTEGFIDEVLHRCPHGLTHEGIARARELGDVDVVTAAAVLGNGAEVSAQDTVPFCIWAAARHLGDYREALWATVAALGDRDTTCAIVGGIVALHVGRMGLPADFLAAREPLPVVEID